MAVPKRKTSPSKRGMRNAHRALKPVGISYNSVTGEPCLPHQMTLKDGYYKGRQVLIETASEEDESNL